MADYSRETKFVLTAGSGVMVQVETGNDGIRTLSIWTPRSVAAADLTANEIEALINELELVLRG